MQLPKCLDDVPLPQELPPLVITAFARPDLLQKVLAAIPQQVLVPSKIIAFVDGARNPKDQNLINSCISLLQEFSQSIPVEIVARTQNLGCDKNVLSAFTKVLSSYDSLVYLEDDDLPNRYFYDRICRLLELYRDFKQVCSVSAYANFPGEFTHHPQFQTHFIVSHRVFSWGFGIWADRWHAMNLVNQSPQYNPFGSFCKIPTTIQTKMTMVNQFWLEKNKKTDWVITLTLASLSQQKIHIIPKSSLIYNIGFGHPESETYKKAEESWVNSRYDVNFCPNSLPDSLELPDPLKRKLTDRELFQHLLKQKALWLNPTEFLLFCQKVESFKGMMLLIHLFVQRLPILLRRWRSGLLI